MQTEISEAVKKNENKQRRQTLMGYEFSDADLDGMLFTWWPALRCPDVVPEPDDLELAHRSSRPGDLCGSVEVPIVLEPWPRVQVIPKSFLCRASPEAAKVSKNACEGQVLLAHYNQEQNLLPSARELKKKTHHPPDCDGDVTMRVHGANIASHQGGALQYSPSERAVRCQVLRPLVSADLVTVLVRLSKGQKETIAIPLKAITEVQESVAERMKRTVRESRIVKTWRFKREEDGRIHVFAVHQRGSEKRKSLAMEDAVSLDTNSEVLITHGADQIQFHRPVPAKVFRVSVRPTHYEVKFENPGNADAHLVPEQTLQAVFEGDEARRLQRPEMVVHDLLDDMDVVEVQVGVSTGNAEKKTLGNIHWSESSKACTVETRDDTLFAPVGPVAKPVGVNKAEIKWLCPSNPAALLFRIRMREVGNVALSQYVDAPGTAWRIVEENYNGTDRPRYRDDSNGSYWVAQEDGICAEQAWDCIGPSGRPSDQESSMAWTHRIVPLSVGQWILAYGQCDGQKSATPAPAIVNEVCDITAKIIFAISQSEIKIGNTSIKPTTEYFTAREQEVPIDWIDAVWVQDREHFLKGKPSVSNHLQQPLRFELLDDTGDFGIVLVGSKSNADERVEGMSCDALHVKGFEPDFVEHRAHTATATLGCLTLRGLEPKREYEICVQALTGEGWTPWTEAAHLQMPRTAYEQEQLVIECQANGFYKSDLLPYAFYKNYGRCQETIQNLLKTERYERIKPAIDVHEGGLDPNLRGWLVSMSGPVRLSTEVSGLEAAQNIRSCVERGADVNHRSYTTGRTPLIYAVEYLHLGVKMDAIKELLALKAEVDAMNDSRWTALAVAADRGSERAVRYLLEERGADATIINIHGKTAYLCARDREDMSRMEREAAIKCRQLLTKNRVPWNTFEEEVVKLAAEDGNPIAAAKRFLQLAFPEIEKPSKSQLFVTDSASKFGKRICKFDRLRLYEQIQEADEEERVRRGRLCGEVLLIPSMEVASMPPPSGECSLLTWYLLYSDVARFVIDGVKTKATDLLKHHEGQLNALHGELKILRTLTKSATSYPSDGGGRRELFNGNPLHQWHAHSNLHWLTEQSLVTAFETLITSGTFATLEEFCTWVGELNAGIAACDGDPRVPAGAWDGRLPLVFWGSVYSLWLLREAARVQTEFHRIAKRIVEDIRGDATESEISYVSAPNKGKARLEKKQKDYASPGLHVLHEALDLMPGYFSKAYRTDLGEVVHTVEPPSSNEEVDPSAPILVLGDLSANEASDVAPLACKCVMSIRKQEKDADLHEQCDRGEMPEHPTDTAINQAIMAIQRLKSEQYAELRSLPTPPLRILQVAEVICVLFGKIASKNQHLSSSRSTDYWGVFLKEICGHDLQAFKHMFTEFDKDAVAVDLISRIETIVLSQDFQDQVTQKFANNTFLTAIRPIAGWANAIFQHQKGHKPKSVLGSSLASSTSLSNSRPLVVVALVLYHGATDETFAKAKAELIEQGADAVVNRRFDLMEAGGAREMLMYGLRDAFTARGLPPEDVKDPPSVNSEKAQLLFEMRKCTTAHPGDLLTAGGLLDLVRGCIECTTEEQVRAVYERAMRMTISDDLCQVVRVKNGFHTPAVGGYADLKLFLHVARDGSDGGVKAYHICELQVHLKDFLACKKYTHLPYQADRGDFDPN